MSVHPRPSLLPKIGRLFVANARLYCLSALIVGLLGIASLTLVSILVVRGAGEGPLDPRAIWQSMTGSHQISAFLGMLLAVLIAILIGARGVCGIDADQLSGSPLSLVAVLIDMAKFIPAALVYSFIIGLPTVIGSTILFVPGMAIASLFVLVVPAGAGEALGFLAALRRGFSLGNRV